MNKKTIITILLALVAVAGQAKTSKTQKAVHNIMVTTDGLAHNAYSKEIQNEVCLGDLFL